MFYYLYQITNNLNGKIYIGVHKTSDIEDGYMGSGKIIRRAIKKHGAENFSKVILKMFNSSEDMFAKEREIVDENFLARKDVYNLCRGGSGGGFDWINKNLTLAQLSKKNKAGGFAYRKKLFTDQKFREKVSETQSKNWYKQKGKGKISIPPQIKVSCMFCKLELTTSNLTRHIKTNHFNIC